MSANVARQEMQDRTCLQPIGLLVINITLQQASPCCRPLLQLLAGCEMMQPVPGSAEHTCRTHLMPPCRQLAHPVQPIVFLPHNISTAKMDQLQQQGAQTVQHGTDCVEAELQAKAWAHQTGAVYISPYNDLQVSGWARRYECNLQLEIVDLTGLGASP